MTPPQILRALRTAAGHSQAKAAELVSVDPRSWERWETGTRRISRATLELYALQTGQRLALERMLADADTTDLRGAR